MSYPAPPMRPPSEIRDSLPDLTKRCLQTVQKAAAMASSGQATTEEFLSVLTAVTNRLPDDRAAWDRVQPLYRWLLLTAASLGIAVMAGNRDLLEPETDQKDKPMDIESLLKAFSAVDGTKPATNAPSWGNINLGALMGAKKADSSSPSPASSKAVKLMDLEPGAHFRMEPGSGHSHIRAQFPEGGDPSEPIPHICPDHHEVNILPADTMVYPV